jgi:hypothetical protein
MCWKNVKQRQRQAERHTDKPKDKQIESYGQIDRDRNRKREGIEDDKI